MTNENIRTAILTVLRDFTKEMEGYSYFGSNPGVSQEDYYEIATEVVKSLSPDSPTSTCHTCWQPHWNEGNPEKCESCQNEQTASR